MAKVYGVKQCYVPVRETYSKTIISYSMTPEPDGVHATWYEVYFNKKQVAQPSLEQIKDAVINDIDAHTDAKILNGYQFTPDGEENPITVWLSKESQMNFSEAHRLQIVPVKFKLNETDDKHPIYHTFETFEELNRFYIGGVAYINQCLNEGWVQKDSIDWEQYKE